MTELEEHRAYQARQMQYKLLMRIARHASTMYRHAHWRTIMYAIAYGSGLRRVLTIKRDNKLQQDFTGREVIFAAIDEAAKILAPLAGATGGKAFPNGGVVTGRWKGTGIPNGSEAIIPKAMAEHRATEPFGPEARQAVARTISVTINGPRTCGPESDCCGSQHAKEDEGSDCPGKPHGAKS